MIGNPEGLSETPRFDGSEAWSKLSPDEKMTIGAIALEYVIALTGRDALIDEHRSPRLRQFEAADRLLSQDLIDSVSNALTAIVPALHDEALPVPLPAMLGPACRVCGCSEYDACGAGCSWAEADLCSSCHPASK